MIIEKNKCTGCQTCVSVCPVNCITMSNDNQGFLYPTIDTAHCIKCGKCTLYCPINRLVKEEQKTFPDVYLAWSLDEEILEESSAGGVFSRFAKDIINRHGYVSAAIYDTNFNVKHIVSSKLNEIEEMSKSKYAQSDVGNIYKRIGSLLKEENTVLFCGTTCQVYGLFSYLKMQKVDTEKLYTIDLICHGVPSPKFLQSYIHWLEKKYAGNAAKLSMRKKIHTKGNYTQYAMWIEFDNHKEYYGMGKKDFFQACFHNELISRPSCYSCPFKTIHRISDLTIGDCWFSDYLTGNKTIQHDVTLCMIQSEKGRKIICNNDLFGLVKVDAEKSIKINNGMIYSCGTMLKGHDELLNNINGSNFEQLVKYYLPPNDKSKSSLLYRTASILKKISFLNKAYRNRQRRRNYRKRLTHTIDDKAFSLTKLND